MTVVPLPLIEIAGATPYERGASYGRQAADRVKASAALYGARLGKLDLSADAVRDLVRAFVPRIEAFEPGYVEEMRGIAAGAGVAFEQVALVNARTEILKLGERRAAELKVGQDGCTGAVILPEATRDGNLIHGQNWDWLAECAKTTVVLRVRRDDAPSYLTFTEAGGLARAGMNSLGTAITANYLESDRDYRTEGVPLALIRRKALESAHFAHAVKAVATTPKSASNNMILSTAEGFAIDWECAPDEAFPVYPEDGLIVHANHWQSPVALAKLKEAGTASTPESCYRDWRVRRLLAPDVGRLTRDHLRAALFDDFGSPYSVCRPPRPNEAGNLSATVLMLLMEPALGVMEIAPLPAVNRSFTTYTLPMESAATRKAAE
ncbi:MAG: acyl-CoA--6-aminopenicillanic acid acyltransferase [Rhodospirillales bacterium]|nr:acyl-CoA--6-aminopenicillanic acid acyltransferase [Rhodospirillales bacterium]